jgi:hypothetical protein
LTTASNSRSFGGGAVEESFLDCSILPCSGCIRDGPGFSAHLVAPDHLQDVDFSIDGFEARLDLVDFLERAIELGNEGVRFARGVDTGTHRPEYS